MASPPRYCGHPTHSIKLCKSVPGGINAVLKATDGLYMNLIDKLFITLFLKATLLYFWWVQCLHSAVCFNMYDGNFLFFKSHKIS